VIGLASIMAKVTRDGYMMRRAKLASYNVYNFDIHKGYGTKAHREVIMEYGLSKEHRVSFCKNLKK
jgi:ribonuclease HII